MSTSSHSDFSLLVVDDDPVCRELLGAVLKSKGFKATCVADAQTGLNLLNRERFDLIILDNEMPNLSGLDMLKMIRADVRFRSTPVLILTVTTSKPIVLDAIKLGVCGYISKKSFLLERILEKIQSILNSRAAGNGPATAAENAPAPAAEAKVPRDPPDSQVARLSRAILGPETPPTTSATPATPIAMPTQHQPPKTAAA